MLGVPAGDVRQRGGRVVAELVSGMPTRELRVAHGPVRMSALPIGHVHEPNRFHVGRRMHALPRRLLRDPS